MSNKKKCKDEMKDEKDLKEIHNRISDVEKRVRLLLLQKQLIRRQSC